MKKRSQKQENARNTLSRGGVGGRQSASFLGSQGGGYLDNYSFSQLPIGNLPRDPRLDTLRRMGIHHTWQKVAETIGMDAFLAMWRILDAQEQFQHCRGSLEINLRRYSSYLRFQRNEFIKDLAESGLSNSEIAERLDKGLCEKLQLSHIKHIVKKG